MVFSIKFGKFYSTNAFLDGKITHGHNLYALPTKCGCRSLDQWIPCILTRSCSLGLVNSLKIQWIHLTYKDTFYYIVMPSLATKWTSVIFIGNKPLTTNNMKSSRKPTCVKSSFLNVELVKKTRNIGWKNIFLLFDMGSWSSGDFNCYII